MMGFDVEITEPTFQSMESQIQKDINMAIEAGARHYRNRLRREFLNASEINPETLRRVSGTLADDMPVRDESSGDTERWTVNPLAPYAIYHDIRFAPVRGRRNIWIESLRKTERGVRSVIGKSYAELKRLRGF